MRPEVSVIVTGSLAAKVADRTHTRDEVRPVHVVDVDGVRAAPWFDDRGEHGVGALLVDPDGTSAWCSTGDDLLRLDLVAGTVVTVAVPELLDVHEIERDGAALLLANTGHDEVVVCDGGSGHVHERIDLAGFRTAREGTDAADRFHLNQALVGPGNRRWALVHHVEGYQLMRKVATKALKVQGDGGLVALDDGERRVLRLTAPHSITHVGDRWWIFDSGRSELRIYDEALSHTSTTPTAGWGRGAVVDEMAGVVYAGMSPIRRRYLGVVPGRHVDAPCVVEVLAAADGRSQAMIEIPDIEQINNVYLVPSSVGDAVVGFAP